MRKTLHLLSLTTAITLLSSCGTFRKTKHVAEETTKTEVSTHAVESKTITEKADTTVVTKADSVHGSIKLVDLEKGDTLHAETDKTDVEVFYDPTTGKVTAKAKSKPQEVHFTVDKVTVSNSVIDKDESTEHKSKSKDVETEKKSNMNLFWWGMLCGVILVVGLFFAWKFVRQYLKTFFL